MSRKLAALVAALLASVAIAVSFAVDDDGVHGSVTVTTKNQQGEKVKVEAPTVDVQDVDASGAGHHAEDNLRSETGADPGSSNLANPDGPKVTGPVPLASAHQAGCLTRQIPANWSYRTGVRPSLVVLHFTVSPNRPGWDDVNGIVAFFSRSATSASSNYVIDNEGHCVLMVSESYKAWAQAGFNSATACSIEVINTGSEATYIGPPGGAGERKLARVVHDCAARWNIPLQRGATSGCSVLRAGVVDHQTLAACGGGHFDIGKYRPASIVRALSGGEKPVSARQKRRCYTLNHLRRRSARYHRRHHLPPARHPLSDKEKELAKRILAGQRRFDLKCRVGKRPHLVRA